MKNTRKLVSLLFAGLFLLTSLIALVGGSDEGFTHTLPEELVDSDAPLAVPSEGVAPCIDCNHTYGYDIVNKKDYYACCKYVEYEEVYCRDCGTFLKTQNSKRGTDNHHLGEWTEGTPLLDEDHRWIVEFHCSDCGAYGGWRYLT